MRPLLQRWPNLQSHVQCEEIASLPTPVIPLPRLSPSLWMKCDQLTHTVYGGNKIRKLEFILPQLKQQQIRQVVSLGGIGTNSGTALAMVCQELGIKCRLYLFDQQMSAAVEHNYASMRGFGAELVHVKTSVMAGLRYYLDWRRLDRRRYFLYGGCSNAVSVFGYVNALLELRQQVEAGECPTPAQIVVATGSCSTLAGLLLGAALIAWDVRIIGIRVAPDYVGPAPGCTPGLVTALMRQALEFIIRAYPEYRSLQLPTPVLLGDYYGAGYGIPSPAGEQALRQAAREGITLENTYTAKAFAAVLDRVAQDQGPVIFWNTHAGAESQVR
jgi:1-aminocyclopropane-1-carboxylate deaminase/D-cysteine desulfhydrase-like pyridoxal-dependent ACC family enzyme